jgi:hypothetical protein
MLDDQWHPKIIGILAELARLLGQLIRTGYYVLDHRYD